jgi:DNA-binding beta-propeller fold protein YncE
MRRFIALTVFVLLAISAISVRSTSSGTASQQPAPAIERDRSPVDLVLTADQQGLLTANQTADTVSLIHMATGKLHDEVPCGKRPSALILTAVVDRIKVGRWPRYPILSPDGKRLSVGTSGDGGVCIVEPQARKLLYGEQLAGINLGQMQASADSKFVYFSWVYRHNPITAEAILTGPAVARPAHADPGFS